MILFRGTQKLCFVLSSVTRTELFKSERYLFPHKSSYKLLSSKYFPTENVTSLKKDTLLYTLEKTKLIRYITIYGIAQCGICTFLGLNVFFSLRDTESLQRNRNMTSQSEEKSWRDLNLGAAKHRLISAVSCFSIGFLTAFICYKLPSRMIKLITLCKGGRTASFVTYGSFGKTKEFKVPLQQLTCVVTRDQATSYIPIKIKNRWFYYLIDCRGQFHQPALFDVTVGAKSWKY
ncbi:transmembrane protein 223 [Caerostris darwini]|uniref:Transmembrane protein 223 n=1 Tax=Caerostris darwini TaxID=1538125 RepID=A0AAV4WVS1_9ARAC|nr:transmembrane protein 223 [Caerostris darwini]